MTDSHSHTAADAASESLIPLTAVRREEPAPAADAQNSRQERVIDHKGERFEVPENLWDPDLNDGAGGVNAGAAAKMALDLRRQLSARAADGTTPPDSYALSVPDALTDMLEANTDHPLFAPVCEWAKEKGLSQGDFDELSGIFYRFEAGRLGRDEADQSELLEEALGEGSDRVLSDLGRWINGLLGEEIANRTDVADTLEMIASSANGILFLKALKDRIGVRGVPSGRSGGTGSPPLTRGALETLQNSPAYRDAGHPDHGDTVRRVRDGFKALYGG